MIQCEACEFFHRDENGRVSFRCDPFSNVKEPECLAKWQLIKMNQMVQAYQGSLAFQRKFAPVQEKMLKLVERELQDMDESEKWKVDDEDLPQDPDDDDESIQY